MVEIQKILGSDIMMVLDECVPYGADEQYTRRSMELSYRWALESHEAFKSIPQMWEHRQFQFAICQGGMFANLRKEYAERVTQFDFDGFSIGGLSVGEPTELMYEATDLTTEILPTTKPRYLMGVGTPENILEAIEPRSRYVRLRSSNSKRKERTAFYNKGQNKHQKSTI